MTGHRPSYLRRIVNLLIAYDYNVVIAMPSQCFDHQVVKEVFTKLGGDKLSRVECNTANSEPGHSNTVRMLISEYRCINFYRHALKEAQKQTTIDLVFIESLDDAVVLSGITGLTFGRIPWMGIVMRQHFHFEQMGAIGPPDSKQATLKHKLFLRLLAKAPDNSLIMTIDGLLPEYIESKHPELRHALAYIPDAVDERVPVSNPDIRKELGIPADAFVVMAYGTLREKKGVNLLVDALHTLPDNIHVMLIGGQRPTIKAYLEQERHRPLFTSGRIHEVDRYIDVSEDANFFTAADLIWVGYENYYAMSAVLVQAAQYCRPVVATNTGLVGWLTNKYQTGVVTDTSNPADIIAAILDASNNNVVPDESQFNALVQQHSLKAFENALMPAVEKLTASG